MKRIILVSLALFINACAHQSVSWHRTGEAARHAVSHPSVWAPLAAASVFAIDDLDSRVANHLSDHAPLFGDSESASSKSDDLEDLVTATALISAFVVPVPEEQNAMAHRGEHLGVVLGGIAITGGITNILKDGADRERPDKSNNKSFPSGHASQSFAAASLASANFHRRWGDSDTAQWADAGLYTAASLTAWARVEAAAHHPADVLAGAALGNFVARFMDELLLTESKNVSVSAFYDGNAVVMRIEHQF